MNIPAYTLYLALAAIAASTLGTYWFIRYARQSGILDHPNTRSSHSTPTPRGGGSVFAVVTIGCWSILALGDSLAPADALALIVPGAGMALTGYLDDRYDLGRRVRLASQVLAATLLLAFCHTPSSPYFTHPLVLLVCGAVIVWLINLYNFMDGIDGIAASYGVTISVLAMILLAWSGQVQLVPAIGVLTASLCGFLFYNWPPAKVFMGDAGSTFLGVTFAALFILTFDAIDWVTWAILFAAFLGDSSITLATRILSGQNWAQPHRLHMYQKLAPERRQHKKISMLYSLYTLFWLFPLACVYQGMDINPVLPLLLAYLPVLVLCRKVSAGLVR